MLDAIASPDAATARPSCTPTGASAPAWFDRLTVATATGILAAGALGLAFGATGTLNRATAMLCVGVALWLAFAVARRAPARDRPSPPTSWAAAAALGIAVLAGAWSTWESSEHLLIDRDPGSYVTTAKWLANGNRLTVDEPLAVFGDSQAIQGQSSAVFDVDGDLEFQFMHLPSAVPALAATLIGDNALLAVNGIVGCLGLLALYSITVRATSRPVFSLVVPAALALSMPFVAVVRDVYSEPYVLLFLWTALLGLSESVRHPDRSDISGLAGVFLGATIAARVDGVPTLALVLIAATAWVIAAPPDELALRAHSARTAIRATAVVALMGTLDLVLASKNYAASLRSNLVLLWAALAFVALLCWLAYTNRELVRSLAARFRHRRTRFADIVAATLAVVLTSLWLLRPILLTAHTSTPPWFRLAEWQAAEGLKVDASRTFAESSISWMGWYLGIPVLVIALASLCWATRALIAGRATPEVALVSLVLLGTGLMYWWKPSINPDQIWATRRFLPVVIPALLVVAAVGTAQLIDRVRSRTLQTVAAGAAAVVFLVPPALVTSKAPLLAEQSGMLMVVREACDLLADDAAVVVLGDGDMRVLPQTLRSWCGVPVAVPSDPEGTLSDQALDSIADDTLRSGKSLWVVTSDQDALITAGFDPGDVERTSSSDSERRLEHTLSRAPARYLDKEETVTVQADYSLLVAQVATTVVAE